MRLRHVVTPPHFSFQCPKCNERMESTHQEPVADLDGTPWRDWYCPECVPTLPTFGMSPAQEAEWNLERAAMAHEASDGSKSE